jgi:signal transduction histidine kinase
MRRQQDEQAAFSRRLIESQEAERKRIAAELHDGLGQSLLVIKNRALLGGMSPEGQGTAKEQFDEISEAASHAIDEARRIAYDLRPYHLDRLGLTQSLEEMIERVAASTSIRFTVTLPLLDGVFSKEGEAIFYRIVQESVSNIVKHSGTNEAVVAIRREEDAVTLTIRDNGKGFSTAGNSGSGGFGLIGLAERVQMLGGTYALDTAPGRGTAITVTAPVR